MNKFLATITVLIFFIEEYRISVKNDIIDTHEILTTKSTNLMNEYKRAYLQTNTRLKKADSVLTSGYIINLSNIK